MRTLAWCSRPRNSAALPEGALGLLALVGAVLLAIFVVPWPWGIAVIAAGALIEVAESLFWLRWSRRRRVAMGAETLVGAQAVVATPCRPEGQVRVQGELWRARCERWAEPGERVTVRAIEELTLLVD